MFVIRSVSIGVSFSAQTAIVGFFAVAFIRQRKTSILCRSACKDVVHIRCRRRQILYLARLRIQQRRGRWTSRDIRRQSNAEHAVERLLATHGSRTTLHPDIEVPALDGDNWWIDGPPIECMACKDMQNRTRTVPA